ncbi:MAG: hypothetical protein Q4G36_06445 [Paracoccus sp. (in: a-proteobacteria)]|nr:hypothetical protein [Paracoccus sp. (in: a-proteobacteria)]
MVRRAEQLAALHRLAKLRMDREIKRFAAFRDHMAMLQSQIGQADEGLDQLFRRAQPFSVDEAQMANRTARQLTIMALQARAEQARLQPGFDEARDRAMREFGRSQVLQQLAHAEKAAAAQRTDRI